MPLTDEEIERLGPHDRLVLIRRLRRGAELDSIRRAAAERMRSRRAVALTVTAVATGLLVPWTAYLALSLPANYETNAWAVTWVGFDVLLMVMLGLTAFFAWKQRMVVVLTAFAAGVLLLADAWFDVTTSDAKTVHLSVASAVLIEIPLAIFLIGMALGISGRVVRLLNATTGHHSAGRWSMPLKADVVTQGDADNASGPAPRV